MAWRSKIWHHLLEDYNYHLTSSRSYSSKVDWDKLRPMILERIKSRAKNYPVRGMVPVAYEVIRARARLIEGLSMLLKAIPVKACKFCPEVFIGERGHMIQTCHGYKRRAKNQLHEWINGSLNDILVPVDAFHLKHMFQDVIKHEQRFDFDRIPAVVELCCQAGAHINDENLDSIIWTPDTSKHEVFNAVPLSQDEMRFVAKETLGAWERLRSGVQKLLLVYPAKVCKYCSEVHVGPSGHRARLCGVFKHEGWRGIHFWKRAKVDDFVPPKIVWRRRPQDPPVLLDKGRDFYGHAPAVVELCLQAGAIVPTKYFCMMKMQGLAPPPQVKTLETFDLVTEHGPGFGSPD
ncbi:PREDICTED: APO protein 4, mitochondrial isoform X2 [Nelumbo nucifera]|nr:PREDICTED: APO protein 4, mitochondrial isoform X2 [Nelumbo nucifera]XP_010248539.1 PREDICTED: APO protein 4, mitochondrial isoform X2 [Nelumbo nucifera]XP_010248547.1 PREDICTED: APO protein 4, mitochondrial isoform X2 [Nelumbo nucifera]XP_010248556.1 PREDICTED: APO protein 4, mitochondrial isoform X2 [Nelumbo nucifera]XP_010248565.1 PREDICTED: APO protein 4, mitochondrial isoform X2 [Nelumbo nucifera]XP_010248574.1 PREDICTED: APO protein 4, mitochondrial isoform X2 [Nelumbo nucifera]XP_01